MKGVLIYLVLVGIPVAGVIGVLQAGRDIIPPPYLGGTWSLLIQPDYACAPSAAGDSLTMVVSQSGPHLAVNFPGSALPQLKGRTNGDSLGATSSSDSVQLHASVKRGENRITGILVGMPCAGARSTTIQGTRPAAPGSEDPS